MPSPYKAIPLSQYPLHQQYLFLFYSQNRHGKKKLSQNLLEINMNPHWFFPTSPFLTCCMSLQGIVFIHFPLFQMKYFTFLQTRSRKRNVVVLGDVIPLIGYLPSRFNFDFLHLLCKYCWQLLISLPVKYCLSQDYSWRLCLRFGRGF